MIILHVHFQMKGTSLEEFQAALKEAQIGEMSRQEEGNLEYTYYQPVGVEDQLLLVEVWKDEDALKTHQQTEHFKAWGEKKKQYQVETKITKYQAEQI